MLAQHPDLLPQGTSGETVLNADQMDALTLRQLQSFIAAVQDAQQQLEGMGEAGSVGVQWPGMMLGTGMCVWGGGGERERKRESVCN